MHTEVVCVCACQCPRSIVFVPCPGSENKQAFKSSLLHMKRTKLPRRWSSFVVESGPAAGLQPVRLAPRSLSTFPFSQDLFFFLTVALCCMCVWLMAKHAPGAAVAGVVGIETPESGYGAPLLARWPHCTQRRRRNKHRRFAKGGEDEALE